MANIDLFRLKQDIIEMGETVALAVIKQMNPAFDDVSYSEAVKLCGSRRWLDYHIKKGTIKPRKRGPAKNSRVLFSRMEIAAVRNAEKHTNPPIFTKK